MTIGGWTIERSWKNVVRTIGLAGGVVAWTLHVDWVWWICTACYGGIAASIMLRDAYHWVTRTPTTTPNAITGADILFSHVARAMKRKRVTRPPASRLDAIARFFWSAKTYERVFKPARADVVHEWLAAEKVGERWKSRWIRFVRAPYTLVNHMLMQLPSSMWKRIAAFFTTSK